MLFSRSREDGTALVETALSMSLFVLLMLGAVEFGGLAYAAIEVSNAAKAAAQYGAQSPATAADLAGMLTAAQNEYFTPAAMSLISPTAGAGYACNCADTGASASCTNNSVTAPPCPGSFLQVTITVHTQATYTPVIHIPGFSGGITINRTLKQKVLQ